MPSPPRWTGSSRTLRTSSLRAVWPVIDACDEWLPPRVGIGVTCLELCAEDKPIWT